MAPARKSGIKTSRIRRAEAAAWRGRCAFRSSGLSANSGQAHSAARRRGVHSGAVQERSAEMRSETSPRALVFSLRCPERNAVSIATCRHSVMTGGERVCV